MNKPEVLNEGFRRGLTPWGRPNLGRLDIPTCAESVKKSFQTLHGINPFPAYSPEIASWMFALVEKLFALLMGGWTLSRSTTTFQLTRSLKRKRTSLS